MFGRLVLYSLRNVFSRTSIPSPTRAIACVELVHSSTNFGSSSIGRLSTQKKPRSSSVFSAVLLPEPEIPLIMIICNIVHESLGFEIITDNLCSCAVQPIAVQYFCGVPPLTETGRIVVRLLSGCLHLCMALRISCAVGAVSSVRLKASFFKSRDSRASAFKCPPVEFAGATSRKIR